ncbi:MAG: hypothetical protein KKD66_26660, partial [Proteobacteria bacterium]|nr:hypothetical protein [Pseudomonadota bacterium]
MPSIEDTKETEEIGSGLVEKYNLKEVDIYLDQRYKEGQLREELYLSAKKNVIPNILKWMLDPNISRVSQNAKFG